MDTQLKDTLARIEQTGLGTAATQSKQDDLLRQIAERQEHIIQLLTPEPKDGPTLDELLGHLIGQNSELVNYARQIIKTLAQLGESLPGDVARAAAGTSAPAANNGIGRGSRP